MRDAENVSAEKTAEKQSTWFPQKNVHIEWTQGSGPQKSEGSQNTVLLSKLKGHRILVVFFSFTWRIIGKGESHG